MTDKMTPDVTDEDRRLARKWAESMSPDINGSGTALSIARVILDAVPTPPRPTLADMTDDERAACLRMQCDTAPNRSVRGFIAEVHPGGCRVIERDTWAWRSCSDDMVTPRPDLPRMEWPGTEKPAPAPALPGDWRLADHRDHGRVIVTTPEPDSGGKVAFVRQNDFWDRKYSGDWCKPDELTYIDTEPEADQ